MANEFSGNKGTIYLRDVPRPIRDSFHASCARRGKTMRYVLMAFMKEFAKRDDDPLLTVAKAAYATKSVITNPRRTKIGSSDKGVQAKEGLKDRRIKMKKLKKANKSRD